MDLLRRLGPKRSGTSRKPTYQSPIGRRNVDPTNPFPTFERTRRPRVEPPPSYEESSRSPTVQAVPIQQTQVAMEDSEFSFLETFDTVFLIDDSGSMAGRSWRETASALSVIAPICTRWDADGLDIYFLNHRNPNSHLGGYTNVKTTEEVQSLFQSVRPLGGTPTGTRLNQILKPYLVELAESLERQAHGHPASIKPLNIIVITDGVPSDDVESVIVNTARKLDSYSADSWQVGIQFFQVGREPEAAENLRELDDALSSTYNIRDMVDTVPWNGDEGHAIDGIWLLKVCLGSVVRRHDRRTL